MRDAAALNYTSEYQWDNDSSQAAMQGLRNFNAAFIGTDKPRQLAIIVRNDEGQNVAGLLGETKWDCMFIGWVWVNDSYQMNGIGTRLMQEAEREAEMECHHTHLTSLDFQAMGFY